jgi:hypothetical protein
MALVGWARFSEEPHGVILPNFFSDHNVPLTAAEKQKAYRDRKKTSGSVTETLPEHGNETVTREEKRREYIPPPPSSSKQGEGGGGFWGSIKERLKAAGVNDAASAVRAAVANGLTPEYVGQLVDAWAAKPGAWAPGALHFRIANAVLSQDPADGWPEPKAAPKKRAQAESGQAKAFAIVKARRAEGATDEQILLELQRCGLEWP